MSKRLYWGCKIKGCKEKHYGLELCFNHYIKKRHLEKPWIKTLKNILKRTRDYKHQHCKKNHPNLKNYLTKEELKFLWFKDKACLMKKPSIDRIDNDGDYMLENCRYIEHRENSGKDNSGESHYLHKLTWGKVRKIRKMYKNKISCKCLAQKYNVCQGTIASIINNKTWKPKPS